MEYKFSILFNFMKLKYATNLSGVSNSREYYLMIVKKISMIENNFFFLCKLILFLFHQILNN